MKIGDPITSAGGRGVVVPGDDVDTDRIIPARYMKVVTFEGLGQYAFRDERFDEHGRAKGHPFDDPRFAGASVLVAGRNFGCGSSREHAPQALWRAGIRVVVAPSFAEIFFGNCTTLGLVCVAVDEAHRDAIAAAVLADPSLELQVDLVACTITAGAQVFPVRVPTAAREALLTGDWDPLAVLRARADKVAAVARNLPYASWSGLAAMLLALLVAAPAHAARIELRPAKPDDLKIGERPLPGPAVSHPAEGGPLKQVCVARREGDAVVGTWNISGCTPEATSAVLSVLEVWDWPLTRKGAPPPIVTFGIQRPMQKPPGSYDAVPEKHDVRTTWRPRPAYPKDALRAGVDATCVADVLVHPWGLTEAVAAWDCPEAFQLAVAKGLLAWEWTAKKAKAPIPTAWIVKFDAPEVDEAKAASRAGRKDVQRVMKDDQAKKKEKAKKGKEVEAPVLTPVDDEPEATEPEPTAEEAGAPIVLEGESAPAAPEPTPAAEPAPTEAPPTP